MKIEIEELKNDVYRVTVESANSVHAGDTICTYPEAVVDLVKEVLILGY